MVIEPTKEQLDDCIAKERMRIKNIAVEKGIITSEELKKYDGVYLDQHGCDSFLNYLSYVVSGKVGYFVTNNGRFLKDRKEIQEKFGVEILSLDELKTKSKKGDK